MVHVNVILWLAMVGAVVGPASDHVVAKWTAITGFVVAALWEHSVIRGFFKSKKKNVQ